MPLTHQDIFPGLRVLCPVPNNAFDRATGRRVETMEIGTVKRHHDDQMYTNGKCWVDVAGGWRLASPDELERMDP